MCMLPIERGPCMNYVERYYFDTSMGKCERFTYGGIIQPIFSIILTTIKHLNHVFLQVVSVMTIISNR